MSHTNQNNDFTDAPEYLSQNREFWDKIAKNWNTTDGINHVVGWYHEHNAWSDHNKILFDNITTKDALALEYGCGPARNIVKFMTPEWGFARIDGVDIAPTNIEKAKLNIEAHGDRNYLDEFKDSEKDRYPILVCNNGWSLEIFADNTYDIVFSVIALQHVQKRSIRNRIFAEIYRVLKPGGWFTAQMGYGPGHPRSVDYYNESDGYIDGDTRVEDWEHLESDLRVAGFGANPTFSFSLRPTCHDEHPQWIWFKMQKDFE
jgi:SAM-dependent methyltransferase